MRLIKARVRNYRSIRDTNWFDVEKGKTILVGPNEAGKTALLQALQQINPPPDAPKLDPLRDYPRSSFNDITTKKADPAKTIVAEAKFALDEQDKTGLPSGFENCIYGRRRTLDNKSSRWLEDAPEVATFGDIRKDLTRLAAHVDSRIPPVAEGAPAAAAPSVELATATEMWTDDTKIEGAAAVTLVAWLDKIAALVDETNATEEKRYDRLRDTAKVAERREAVLRALDARTPVFVLFNNYFRVRPIIHLEHLAQRIETKVLDDAQYDYGNQCLLKLLGFTARDLSNLGKAPEPSPGNAAALRDYRNQLDRRSYQLNAASVRLTEEIRRVWQPDPNRQEAERLRVNADGQYLKVVVEDELGVEIELDQRSEGFQWLVSFFVVFFAEAADSHKNAILLLDEPGLSLHGLKQREFRTTVSRLAENNQTLYTTHSPFLVGPDELDRVRVVEMTDRKVGTKVHTTITAGDSAGLLPLQEALGYDLAQSLFVQQRNLVLEGLTDYWYLEGTANLLRAATTADLNDKVALLPASSAGKVVYYATILHAHKLKVAALLDSDVAGDQAAQQDTLVHTLGNKNILRTKDAYVGSVTKPEIEDLLRDTLVAVAKAELGWDVTAAAAKRAGQSIVDVFTDNVPEFSKYKLAKAYLRWTRNHEAADLAPHECTQWAALIGAINKALK